MMYKIFILFSTGQLFLLWAYLRLNRKKHDIIFAEPLSEYVLYLTYGLVLTSSLLLLISWVIYKTYINPATSKRFEKFTEKLTEKLSVCLKFLEKLNIFYRSYDIIYNHFGTGSPYVFFMMRIMKHILNYSDKKLTLIIFSFVSIPRILVIIVLLTEVFIGHLHYYFYSIYLLLIPLLFRIILFLLKDVQERSFPEASSMVIQEVNPITINNKLCFTLKFTLKPEYAVDGDPNIFFPNFFFSHILFRRSNHINLRNLSQNYFIYPVCLLFSSRCLFFLYTFCLLK